MDDQSAAGVLEPSILQHQLPQPTQAAKSANKGGRGRSRRKEQILAALAKQPQPTAVAPIHDSAASQALKKENQSLKAQIVSLKAELAAEVERREHAADQHHQAQESLTTAREELEELAEKKAGLKVVHF